MYSVNSKVYKDQNFDLRMAWAKKGINTLAIACFMVFEKQTPHMNPFLNHKSR